MKHFLIIYVKLQSSVILKMFFSLFIVVIAISSLNAQTFVDEFQLSKSQDVTHLRVEYHQSTTTTGPSSMAYSLRKGKLHFVFARIAASVNLYLTRSTSSSCVSNSPTIWTEFQTNTNRKGFCFRRTGFIVGISNRRRHRFICPCVGY